MAASVDKTSAILVKEYAAEVGFDLCGIARARSLDEHRPILTKWAYTGMNGDMAYLGQNVEKRIDPRILFPGAKSIIVTGLNYFTEKKQGGNGIPVISDMHMELIITTLSEKSSIKFVTLLKAFIRKLLEDHLWIPLHSSRKRGAGKQDWDGPESILF